MVEYSKEEIEVLKNILTWRIDTGNFLHFTKIIVHENTLTIWAHELEERINQHTQSIWGFLHATPLEDVPLYVNSIPELARWRLMIAK
jgi:hypothetical protein